MKILRYFATAVLVLGAMQASAVPVTNVVLKVTDVTSTTFPTVDPFLDWQNNGGVNEGVLGAAALTNNGIDYKDSWVDTNWGLVDTVRVSMFSGVNEVAYMEFDATGTTKMDFFHRDNLTDSTWGTTGFHDQSATNPFSTGRFFSIQGSTGNDRHWYVNNNWGGCGIDRGWMVVLDGTTSPGYVCNWEDDGADALGSRSRGFMYSTLGGFQNFNSTTIGIADLFAVSVTFDDGTLPVPEPATALLIAAGLIGLRGRKRQP